MISLLMWGCAVPEDCTIDEESLGAPTDWEVAWLESGGAPESPTASTTLAEDGLALSHHDWLPADPDGAPVVLFIHGSSAYGELYAELGAGLADRGVIARLVDLRGHGRSACATASDCSDPEFTDRQLADDGAYYIGRVGDSLDRNQIIRDIGVEIAAISAQWPDAPLILVGHSSGGGVVSRFVEHGGLSQVDRVALVAPFNHYSQPQNVGLLVGCEGLAGTAYAQIDLGAIGAAIRGDVHRYVLRFHKDDAYTTVLDTPANTYTTQQGMAAENPDDFLAAYQQPTLWIAAEEDAVLDLDLSEQQHARMPGGGPFVIAAQTSHIGLAWSDSVAGVLAQWALDPDSVQGGIIQP